MMPWRQARRRLNPRINEEDPWVTLARTLRSEGVFKSIVIAVAFATIASVILMLRSDVVPYRPGQYVAHDINARTEFRYFDSDKFEEVKSKAAVSQPRIFKESRRVWEEIQQSLLALPDRVKGQKLEDLNVELSSVLDNATLGRLQEIAELSNRSNWETSVKNYVAALRKLDLIVLDESVRSEQIATGRMIQVEGIGQRFPQYTYAASMGDAISQRIETAAKESFAAGLWSKIAFLTKLNLVGAPTHEIDSLATQRAENAAKAAVTRDQGIKLYAANQTIVPAGPIDESDWLILREESRAFRESLGQRAAMLEYAGLVAAVSLITAGLCVYISQYAKRIVKNHARAVCICALLLSTLLIAQLTAIGTNRLYFSGIAPTILVAMILSIAYDQRFALGVAALHAALVTMAVGQGLEFYIVLMAGCSMCCLTIDDLRSRSRLIEVGGFTALALMLSTIAMGLLGGNPFEFVMTDALFAGAAGIAVGFVVLGILPFVERAFRITTSMTLLELADTGHPLLRKLAQEAPGTYNHSMQVANLSEEAVAAIGGKSLLARVGAYYHDIGKMNKPEYFIENCGTGSPNRHMTLNPNVSMLIITGHVKDGIELAREYNLPTSLFPFIQSHHGTTLVEYFYWRAVKQEEARSGEEAEVPEHQYRYPGPRPKSKEVGVVMLADAVESICRTLEDPTASRIEGIVSEVIDKRLKDGQFDDCEITMRELHLVAKSLVRTLLGIYHARIAYPTSSATAEPATEIKTA